MLLPLGALVVHRGRFGARRALFACAVAVALSVTWSVFAERFKVENTQDLIAAAGDLSRGWEGGSAVLQTVAGFTDIGGMIRFAPRGMFTALFRPLPGEVMNPFGLIAGVENALLIILFIRAFRGVRRGAMLDPLVRWAALFVFTWALVYGFIAYNLGAIVRFKLQVLPLMLLLLAYLDAYPVSPRAASRTAPVPAD